jgi:DNA-binding MarR family transcriptional regulator
LLPFYTLVLGNLLKKANAKPRPVSRFAYDGLDRVIHERARLSVLTSLITHSKGLPFGELKQLCALTDGNLNRHLTVLEGAKLITISKSIEHNRPQTVCRVTPLGRKRYIEYLAVLEQVILDASVAVKAETSARGTQSPAGA